MLTYSQPCQIHNHLNPLSFTLYEKKTTTFCQHLAGFNILLAPNKPVHLVKKPFLPLKRIRIDIP